MTLDSYANLQTSIAGQKNRTGRSNDERFWEKVDVRGQDECWLWTGAVMDSGYGVFRIGSKTDGTRRNILAHRYVCQTQYETFEGWQALHKCDVKGCVNPNHLYVGTHTQNMADAAERHRMKGTAKPGEGNFNARLKEHQAIEIKLSEEPHTVLALRFGISRTHVGHIKTGKSWGHLNVA